MKKLLVSLTLLLFGISFSQESITYTNKKMKVKFKISSSEFYVVSKNQEGNKIQSINRDKYDKISDSSAIYTFTKSSKSYSLKKQELITEKQFEFSKIEPVLIYDDGTRQIVNGEISLKVAHDIDLKSLLNKWSFTVKQNELDKSVYLLSSNKYSTETIFKIVNELQSNDKILFAEPNFIRLLKANTADPYFTSQWALKNQGYMGGTAGADMKVENAWNYSTGNGIKVAVLDEGVDLQHPDLSANLLAGYDATGNNSNGAPNPNDAHGTACAGIISSIANNNIGTAGVSYDAKIIPIRIAYGSNGSWVSTDSGIANGINWAWQSGADILSNSWGGGSYSSTINNAIINASTSGRNGKGCIVLFSSGNNNGPVSFPANLPYVIAVGASNMFDERKSPETAYHDECWQANCQGGSNYGAEIDVVAPGVMIATTDIAGMGGYSFSDYYDYFNGTSAACPNVAGVMALILSANPNLNYVQARSFLEKNVDKVLPSVYSYQANSSNPNGTWNNQVGYGRVNALKSVEDVIFSNVQISGLSPICIGSNITYTLTNLPSGANVVWSHSSNVIKVSETPNSIVISDNNGEIGDGWIKATIGTKEIVKNIWIGGPRVKMPNGSCGNPYDTVCFNYGNYPAGLTFNAVVDGVGMQEYPNNDVDYEWEKVYGNFTFLNSNNGIKVTGRMAVINPTGGATSMQVRARAKNNCGWGPWKNILFNNYGGRMASDNFFTVSPNPADDFININLSDKNLVPPKSNKIQADLYNSLGVKQNGTTLINNKGTVSVSALIKGVYTLKIRYDNGEENHQVLVK